MTHMQKRSVHGGDDSSLCVEVTPWWQDREGVHVCNATPENATAYGVYIRNPLAMHVSDFAGPRMPATFDPMPTLADALKAAFVFADGLAEHLGCEVVSSLKRPGRWAIEPQRDLMLDGERWLEPGCIPDTNFAKCDEERAEQWAVYELSDVPGDAELVDDYPTRAAAEDAVAALEAGLPLPTPDWPNRADVAPTATAHRDAMAGDFMHYSHPWAPALMAMAGAAMSEREAMNALAGIDRYCRALLVDEMGMKPEHQGGGCYLLRDDQPGGFLLIGGMVDGTGMPCVNDWLIGVYPPDKEFERHDAFYNFQWDGSISLEKAVAAAQALIAKPVTA